MTRSPPKCACTTGCSSIRNRMRAAGISRRASTPTAAKCVEGFVETSLARAQAGERFQFERHGYFVADLVDHRADRPVFNRTATLRDTWSR